MTNVSNRSIQIKVSPIRSLVPFSRRAAAAGKKILYLNIGQPDITTPEPALKAVQSLDTDIVPYGPSEGLPALREKVADYYDAFDAQLQPADVYVTTGASEAILFTLLCCCDEQDEVIIPEPFYANYLGFAQIANVKIVPLTTRLEDGFRLPSPEAFEQLITPKTKAIFLCNPGNPTGQLYNGAQLKTLMKVVNKHGLFLIVDEVYREFCYDQEFTSVLSFRGMEQQVVVIDSISKVFSACGARVGFLITKNRSIQEAVNKCAQLRLCPPFFGQQLALACYHDPAPYIQQAREAYRSRRALLQRRLSAIEGVETYLPAAAFYNMVKLPVADAAHFCQWLLSDFEKEGHTLMLAPGNGFYSNKALGQQQVRIAYVLNEEKLDLAMDCLELGLEQYRRSGNEAVASAGKAQ